MGQYKSFLIQKLTESAPIKDSKDWGVWIKKMPFKVFPDVKDVPSKSWNDQHGDDDYIPDMPFYKAYEIECEFIYKGVNGTAKQYILDFIKYLAENGDFTIYDSYSKIGRTNVRYISYDPDIFYRSDGHDDIVVFKVTMKVNSPQIDIDYVDGAFVDSGSITYVLGAGEGQAAATQNDELIQIGI